MTGASYKITVRDLEVTAALDRLRKEDGGLVPAALKNIGLQLVKRWRRRMGEEKGPDGKAWAPLNPEYKKGKKGAKILQEQGMRGGLIGSLVSQVQGDQVAIGTNKVYGAVHQFGATITPRSADALMFRINGRLVKAKAVRIPARPYLGVSEDDKVEIVQVVQDHIDRVWEGNGA